MMKLKLFAATAAMLLSAVCLSGCGEKIPDASEAAETTQPAFTIDNTDGKDAVLTMEDGSTVVITDDGSLITEVENGFKWNYLAGTATMIFPPEWKDRVVVRDTTVYCKKCFEQNENTGALFSIVFSSDINMIQGPKPAVVFGVVNDIYTVITLPETPDYDTASTELSEEYADLSARLNDVFQTAVCGDSPNFKPINLSNYVLAAESPASVLPGTWKQQNAALETGFVPYTVFRASDSTFGYKYGENDLMLGAFYLNKNAEGYEWNTDNWGDAGIVFSSGNVYRVTYYETEPRSMDFQIVYSAAESDSLAGVKFDYDSEAQSIRQSEGDEAEAHLS